MRGRWRLAFATAAVVAAVGFRHRGFANEGTCELSRVDRASTPSYVCMQCHDGSVGTAIPFQMSGDGKGMSHPVNVDYARVAARRPKVYAPPADLPRDVPLVNGRVECTSCHDGSLSTRNHVVDEIRLCYACHRL